MAIMKQGCWLPDEDEQQLVKIDTFSSELAFESARYHLYISKACPFAHRAYLAHSLMQLGSVVTVSSVAPLRNQQGWAFDSNYPDPIMARETLAELYLMTKPDYSGRVTVPVLWDRKLNRIACNDSGTIARWLATWPKPSAFCLVPDEFRTEIDSLNEWVEEQVNLGVYRAGFATSQSDYETACRSVFDALDKLDERLGQQRYLIGSEITEPDLRFFSTLIRFDAVYYLHFKINLKRISDYSNLKNYLRDLYQTAGFSETVDMEHIKAHYFYSHDHINPNRIIPLGSGEALNRPHNRDRV